MLLETLAEPFAPILQTDATNASYPSKVVTLTPPSGDGVRDLAVNANFAQNGFKIIPYGTTTAVQSFLMRVLGWQPVNNLGAKATWIPHVLGEFTCTLSTMTGVANGTPDASHLICDTITLVAGTATANVSCEVVSPTGNIAAHIMLNAKGVAKVEVIFNLNSSAVSANALVALL